MTPQRVWVIVLVVALASIDSPGWRIPAAATFGLTLSGVIGLFVTPGLVICGLLRRRRAPENTDLLWVVVVGPVVLATVGLVAWLLGNIVPPRLLCRAATITLMGAGLLWTVRQPADLRLSGAECRVLLIALLLTLVAAGRSMNSLGVHGELYAGTLTHTLAADDRADTRAPFIIPIDIANRWQPFSKESQDFYTPFSFTSRGPLVGLAATPVVLTWSRVDMRTVSQMHEPFTPIDRYGYMQYRFSIILLSAAAVIPFFVALGATPLALAGTAVYALSPFVVHEVYFTWTKQSTVALMLSAFCFAARGRYPLSGALAGLAYLAHPSAAYSAVALVAFLVTVTRPATEWNVDAGALLRPSQWWQRRAVIGRFVLGMACVTLPWGLYSYGRHNPAEFLSYLFMADFHRANSFSEWIISRLDSLESTLVPMYAYWRFHMHASMQPVFEAPLQVVTFFAQYFYTLPAGVGFVWFFWHFRDLLRSLRRVAGFAAILIGLPAGIFWIHWGATVTGMLREGLHVPFAFLMLTWVRFLPSDAFNWVPIHRARAVELLVFIWLPTILSNGAMASPALFFTDLLGLLITFVAVRILIVFARLPPTPGTDTTSGGNAPLGVVAST